MPGRPQSHDNAEASRRAFESAIPDNWTFTTPSGDYGVDGDVEVFDRGAATGIHFLVQLKSVELINKVPKKSIRNTSRNYWAALDLPTLIVLWEATSGMMWWKWAHLVDDWGADPDNETLTVHFEDEWADDTPSVLLDEVRAQRALGRGDASLPVFVSTLGDKAFIGERPGPLIAMVRQSLVAIPGLTFVASQKRDLVLNITFDTDFVVVRLSGAHPRYMHYPALAGTGRLEEEDRSSVVANILIATYMALRSMGLSRQAYEALKRALPDASSVYRSDLIDILMRDVVEAQDSEALIVLVQRTVLDANSGIQEEAAVALMSTREHIRGDNLELLVNEFESAAKVTGQANLLYNAAQLVRVKSSTRARGLYFAAADMDPSYKTKPYWLSDVGATFYFDAMYAEAESYYRKAQASGAPGMNPLIGDVVLRQGRYAEAVVLYEAAVVEGGEGSEYWALYLVSFSYLIERFALPNQCRQPEAAERKFEALSMEEGDARALEEVLASDLLSPFALWRLTISERLAGKPILPLLLAGALLLERFAPMWDEAIRAANSELPAAIGPIISAIKRHCRDEFITFLYADDFVDDEFRTTVVAAFDETPDMPDQPVVIRAYETYDDSPGL
jgi:tetratricopeptide (TPR) repeat protein